MDTFKPSVEFSKALKSYLDIAAEKGINREIALKLAELNIPVLPCRATPLRGANGRVLKKEKSPLIPKGVYGATTDQRQIQAWWREWPDALPGLPTGERTGLWVLDADAPTEHRQDGLKGLAALTAQHGDLITFTVVTSGGGFHFYFLWEGGLGNSTGRLPRGMDARGAGGYVIAPGARLPDGRRWKIELDFAFASIPNWLRAQVAPAERYALAGIHQSVGETAPGVRELERLCELLSNPPRGPQQKDLFWIAAAAGNLVGAGEVLCETAEARLLGAAHRRMMKFRSNDPWPKEELKRQIRNGLVAGRVKPLRVGPPPLSPLEEVEALIRLVEGSSR